MSHSLGYRESEYKHFFKNSDEQDGSDETRQETGNNTIFLHILFGVSQEMKTLTGKASKMTGTMEWNLLLRYRLDAEN